MKLNVSSSYTMLRAEYASADTVLPHSHSVVYLCLKKSYTLSLWRIHSLASVSSNCIPFRVFNILYALK